MSCLMKFATSSLTLIATFNSMMTSSLLMTLLFIIFPPLDEVRLSESKHSVCCQELEECHCKSNGLKRFLMKPLTYFQSWLSNLIIIVKLQTVSLQSLFHREGMVLLNLMRMMCQSHQSTLQREYPPLYLLLNWMRLLLLWNSLVGNVVNMLR